MEENNEIKGIINEYFNSLDKYDDVASRIVSLKEQLKDAQSRFDKLETQMSGIAYRLIKNGIPEKSIVERGRDKYVFDFDKKGASRKAQIADNLGNAKYFTRHKIVDLSHF
jgi:hypothetical protein